MVSERTSDMVWNQVVDIKRLSRYWGAVASNMGRWHKWRMIVLLLPTTGAIVSLLQVLPGWMVLAVNALFAVLACWTVIGNPTERVVIVQEVSRRCHDLELKVEALWRDLDQLDDVQARRLADDLDREINHTTTRLIGIRIDNALNELCEADANRAIRHEYAVQ